MAFSQNDDISINTLVGPGSFLRGSLRVKGFVRIDGDIDGNLETSGKVIIGEDARIRGSVISRSVTIGGIVQGDVVAPEGISLLEGAIVLGAVLTKKLQVADSVLLNGPCFAVNDQARFDQALGAYNNKKALRDSSAGRYFRAQETGIR